VRRLLSGPVAYARDLSGALGRSWGAFFFTPADPTPLGLIRLATGALVLWNLAVYGMELHDLLGSEGWGEPATVARVLENARSPWSWSFWFWVPDSLLRPAWAACLAVAALFAAGLWSRVTAALTWAIVVSTARRSFMVLYGFDQILSLLTFYLAVTGASGQAVSLDRFLARRRRVRAELDHHRRRDGRPAVPSGAPAPSVSANLGLRLIQLHLCLIYGMAGLAKLQGRPWWDGYAAWLTVAAGEFRRFDMTWLAAPEYEWLLNLATHLTIFVEVGFVALIWVRPLRPLLLATIALMHFAIDLTLGLTEFGLAMLAALVAFVSGAWLRSLVVGLQSPSGRLYFDGTDPRARRVAARALAADPDRVVEPIDVSAAEAPPLPSPLPRGVVHLVRSDGRVVSGPGVPILLARWLPLYWPLGLVTLVPGVAGVIRRLYNPGDTTRPRDAGAAPATAEARGGRVGAAAKPGRPPR
jgi:hypothetical protein